MDKENKKDLTPAEEARAWLEDILAGTDSSTEAPAAEAKTADLPVADAETADAPAAPDADELALEQILQEAKEENWTGELPAVDEPDAFDDPELQEALEALREFSARYDEIAAEVREETAARIREAEAQEEEKTVQFEPPASTQEDSLDSTRQFAPVETHQTPDAPEGTALTPETEALPPVPPRRKAPVRKVRPKGKKGYGLLGLPHVAATAIWLAIVVTIGISLGRVAWVCAADLLAFGKPDREITITIDETDNINTIADKLGDVGVVRYPGLFLQFAKLTGKGEGIIPGTYVLNSKYDYNALLKIMTYVSTEDEVVEVMIPEGYNCAQIFRLLEQKGVCTAAALEDWAANGELDDYWFLEGLPRGTKYCLEGYLFPDTYKFYKDDDPRRVLEKFLDDFDYRFTEKMYQDFIAMQERFGKMLRKNGYSTSYVNSHKLTFHQLVTMASMVEEEKATAAEGYEIASVIYNRLAKPGSYPRLDIDATVYYAIGSYLDRKPLTSKDLDSDSPYNTRKSSGMPPGPISNPGYYSLYAALYPTETSYYYYIYDPKAGIHRFSKTLAEHNKWADKLGY